MACSSCNRTASQISALLTRSIVERRVKDSTLSAAKLTPAGWVATCTLCGKESTTAKFPDAVSQLCTCKF